MKHSFEDELIKELETLDHSFHPSTMQKEKMKRNVFQGQNTKFSQTQNWLPIITSIIFIFSIGFGMFTLLGSESGFNINSNERENQDIVPQFLGDESLDKVSFKDKIKFLDIASLPFKIEFTSEELTSLNNEQVFHRYYMNKTKGNLLELQVTEANIIPSSQNRGLTDIHLNGNINAKYSTNGIVESLYWKDDGLSYRLISSFYNTEDKTMINVNEKSLGIEKLVEIVEKMK